MTNVSLSVFDHFPLCMFSQLLFLHLLQPLNLRGSAKKTEAGLWSCFDSIYNVKWLVVRVAGVMVLESFGSHLNRSMGFLCRSLSFPSSLKPSTNDPWKMLSHFFCDGLANATPGTLWDLFRKNKLELELLECIYGILALGDWYRLMHHCTPVHPYSPNHFEIVVLHHPVLPWQSKTLPWKFSDTCRSTMKNPC